MIRRLHGSIAAALTPMRDGGRAVDLDSIPRYAGFLAAGRVDGALVCGTTGEGMLLDVDERRSVAEAFVSGASANFDVAVHAGAQTSLDTIALAAHAQSVGAAAVAVVAPPYHPLDDDELTRHLVAAANAADPLPFYVYEFAARSGYAIPPAVVSRVTASAPNVVGMKVSDTPFAAVEPYLRLGLDVFVGSEPLVLEGLTAGAVGCVSGLAAAFPEVVAELVHERSELAHEQVCRSRDELAGVPFHAALKQVLVARDVLVTPDVRPPLRGLSDDERGRVLTLAHDLEPLES
ncbi:MAG TPA: dihydrodipicolinate synthase family protein [Actinomycetota bacterium]|nr:dihydrodipicolinate synthase family protein [Actinomycetota bacterium]